MLYVSSKSEKMLSRVSHVFWCRIWKNVVTSVMMVAMKYNTEGETNLCELFPSFSMIMSITKALQQPKCPAQSVVTVMTKGKTNQMELELLTVLRLVTTYNIYMFYIYISITWEHYLDSSAQPTNCTRIPSRWFPQQGNYITQCRQHLFHWQCSAWQRHIWHGHTKQQLVNNNSLATHGITVHILPLAIDCNIALEPWYTHTYCS